MRKPNPRMCDCIGACGDDCPYTLALAEYDRWGDEEYDREKDERDMDRPHL